MEHLTIDQAMENLDKQFAVMKECIAAIKRSLKPLKVAQQKLEKQAEKKKVKKTTSHLQKPVALKDELCEFLGIPAGSTMARTEVTKKIHEYVVANSLQDPENKRKFNLDEKLKTLLAVDEGVQVHYFNLQKYLAKNFA